MKLFRPAYLRLELRDCIDDRLQQLLSANPDPASSHWWAVAGHLAEAVELQPVDLEVLRSVPLEGCGRAAIETRFGAQAVQRLLEAGILLSDAAEFSMHRDRDQAARSAGWWGPALLAHVEGRWSDVDAEEIEAREGKRRVQRMVAENGLPPGAAPSLCPPAQWLALPAATFSALAELMSARSTCRNFDRSESLPLASVSNLLHSVFGAQGRLETAPGVEMLKKNSPSGGSLHPVEAYLLVQDVRGLEPGLYHYQCVEHVLEPLRAMDRGEAAAAAHELVAGQRWFVDAPVLLLLAARFRRTYWKYPQHTKAWRVIHLDAGHLSQNLYLAATEMGYGAFITAAINDACAERLFGLDGIGEGAIAVCGFGRRAAQATHIEFDPLGKAVR